MHMDTTMNHQFITEVLQSFSLSTFLLRPHKLPTSATVDILHFYLFSACLFVCLFYALPTPFNAFPSILNHPSGTVEIPCHPREFSRSPSYKTKQKTLSNPFFLLSFHCNHTISLLCLVQ